MEKSCIVQQFNRYAELTEQEAALLDSLEREPREYQAGETLYDEGADAACFFTLRSGWAYASRTLADGERQVLDIFLPGQIMGLREVGFNRSLSTITLLTDAVVCPFPKQQLTEIFEESPRLSALFFLALAYEESILIERIINISRRSSAKRLAHFIVEMKLRLHKDSDQFELPMNQAIIGDTLGMSAVHVSRSLKCLREQNLVSMEDGRVNICDLSGLTAYAEFEAAYLDHKAGWPRQAMRPAADLRNVFKDSAGGLTPGKR